MKNDTDNLFSSSSSTLLFLFHLSNLLLPQRASLLSPLSFLNTSKFFASVCTDKL